MSAVLRILVCIGFIIIGVAAAKASDILLVLMVGYFSVWTTHTLMGGPAAHRRRR